MQRHIVTARVIEQRRSAKARSGLRKVETKIVYKKREYVAVDGLKSPKNIIDDHVIDTDENPGVNGPYANAKDDEQDKVEGEGEPGTRWLPCNIL
jgi:hypothetical protein